MKKKRNHDFFIKKTLLQAHRALQKNEVPVGAIVVDSKDNIVASGYNQIEKTGCQCAHAEVIAIKKASKKLGTWRLDNCSIYATLEPCLMCLGLIQLSRLKALYFGASCLEFGSGILEAKKHKLYKKDLLIKGGFREEECIKLLKDFFIKLRKKRKEVYETKNGVS